jgi:hypothetical protein
MRGSLSKASSGGGNGGVGEIGRKSGIGCWFVGRNGERSGFDSSSYSFGSWFGERVKEI